MFRLKSVAWILVNILVASFALPLQNNDNLQDANTKDISVTDTIIAVNEGEDIALFEGDIVLSNYTQHVINHTTSGGSRRAKRSAMRARKYLWHTRIIPYEMDGSLSDEQKTRIEAAMRTFETATCLQWKLRSTELNWIKFVNKPGCWSSVGKAFWREGAQEISAGNNCRQPGVIIHEMLHALGFWHEQSRPDRNQYVEIMWENIMTGKENNFEKYSHGELDILGAQYDYGSVMHYGKYAFSKNGKPTLLAVGNANIKLGQRNGLSTSDVIMINALYDCSNPSGGWSSWSSFSRCDGACNKYRQRFCTAVDRQTACPGADQYGIETENQPCSNEECFAPVDGHWGRWSPWSACGVSCGQGKRTRTRKCNDPPNKYNGKYCSGSMVEVRGCMDKPICGEGSDDCHFDEKSWCHWTTDDTSTSPFPWYRGTQGTPTRNTGPSVDHTSGTGGFLYAESSSPVTTGQTTRLISKEFVATSGRCLAFYYSMYGDGMGTLNVYIKQTNNGNMVKVWDTSGNQGQQWHRGNVTIATTEIYHIVFESVRGSHYRSDMGLDDITFTDGSCTVAMLTLASAPVDGHWGRWSPWSTCSVSCGQGSHTRTRKCDDPPNKYNGKYCSGSMVEVRGCMDKLCTVGLDDCDFDEKPLCHWKTDVTGSSPLPWYRETKGTPTRNTGPSVDHTSGTGGFLYAESSSPVSTGQTTRLISKEFVATSGRCLAFYYSMYGAGMGTLNVYIKQTNNGNMAKVWEKSGNQGQQWQRDNITIATTGNYHIVFESVCGSDYRSDMGLDDITFTDGSCTVAMTTVVPTILPVTTLPPTTSALPPTTSALPPTTSALPPTTLYITTSSPLPPDHCDFGTTSGTFCTWRNDPTNSKTADSECTYSWWIHRGPTPSRRTGPQGDHTRNGYYAYLEGSSPFSVTMKARLLSQNWHQPSSSICMDFWYFMYGASVGSLSVYNNTTSGLTSLWTISGNQGQQWRHAQIAFSSSLPFKVIFEGVHGDGYLGDIALDDVTITYTRCV